MTTYLAGPAIARLLATSLMTANRHLRAGNFGPLLHRGPVAFAPIKGVEQHVGRRFSPEQIDAAVDEASHVRVSL